MWGKKKKPGRHRSKIKLHFLCSLIVISLACKIPKHPSLNEILDASKLKEFAEENFKFSEMVESSPNG